MSDFNVSRLGQVNEQGNDRELFLKKFGGEVLTAYHDKNVTNGTIMEKNVSAQKSAQFPAMGKVGSGYHVPGTEIKGQKVPHAEVTIAVDGLLYSDTFVDNLDEWMNHYEVRAPYSTEMGEELALQYDMNNLRCVIQAARGSAIVKGTNGGSVLKNANFASDNVALADGIWEAAEVMDEKNTPSQRWCVLRPSQYYMLARNTDLMNQNWNGAGNYAQAVIPTVAGVSIVKCNHLPNENEATDENLLEKFRADYSKTRGVVYTNRAAGVVKLKTVSTETEYSARHQGTLMIAKYAVGHGPLRSDNAVELSVAAT